MIVGFDISTITCEGFDQLTKGGVRSTVRCESLVVFDNHKQKRAKRLLTDGLVEEQEKQTFKQNLKDSRFGTALSLR